jgi:hypothetical protein
VTLALIPTGVPSQLRAGDTWRWDRTIPSYSPADGWSLKYAIAGLNTMQFTAVANAGNNGWEVTVLPATTLDVARGNYTLVEFITNVAGERYTLASYPVEILPDLVTATPGLLQSFEEKAIAVIEASFLDDGAFEDWMEAFTIEGRSVQMMSIEKRYELLEKFRQVVARKKNGGRLPSLRVRFGIA